MFIKELEGLGLSTGEAKIYGCLLNKGDLSASEIAKETGLGRTNIYEYAELLEKKGLMEKYEKKSKNCFHAASPQVLTELVDNQLQQAKQNEASLGEMLPKLLKLYDKNEGMPTLKNLMGDSGFREFCNNLYLKGGSEDIFFYLKNLDMYEPPEPRFLNKIQERNLHIYLFACKGENINEFQKRDLKENRTTRIKDISLDTDIAVYEDKIYFGKLGSRGFKASVIQNYAFAHFLAGVMRLLV